MSGRCSFGRPLYQTSPLHYTCIQSSGIILILWATFVPNFVSIAASVTELAHGEKSHTQSINHSVTQSPSLFDAPETKAFASEHSISVHILSFFAEEQTPVPLTLQF